jgi:DNA-binding SARP family transcriptional activator/TolB-like protein
MAIEIQTLGGLKVLKDDVERPELRARKLRCALLIYLGIEGEATKDTLTRVFWPDDETTKVASRLSSNIKSIRDDCGPDCIQTHGDSYKANPDLLGVDVPRFRAAVRDGKFEAALGLYRGGFLVGEHLSGSGQFEDWRERVENDVVELHRRAFRLRVDELVEAGRLQDAADIANQWATSYPTSVRGNHAYAQLLAMTDEPARALRHLDELYERFQAEDILVPGSLHDLRRSIEDEEFQSGLKSIASRAPSPDRVSEDRRTYAPHEDLKGEKPKKKKVLQAPVRPPPGSGARASLKWVWGSLCHSFGNRPAFKASAIYAGAGFALVQTLEPLQRWFEIPDTQALQVLFLYLDIFPIAFAAVWVLDPTRREVKGLQRKARSKPTPVWWKPLQWTGTPIAIAIALSAYMAVVYMPRSEPRPPIPPGPYRLAILPILAQDSTDQELVRLGNRLTSSLIDHFTDYGILHVPTEGTVEQYRDRRIPTDSVARALQATFIVEGRVQRRSAGILVNLTLADSTGGGLHSRGHEVESRSVELNQELLTGLIPEVTDGLRRELGSQIRDRELHKDSESLGALNAVLDARSFRQQARNLTARMDLEQACWALQQADSLLVVASDLDARWAEPHVLRGSLAELRSLIGLRGEALGLRGTLSSSERDSVLLRGIEHVEQALEIAPGDPKALERKGFLQFLRLQLVPERPRAERAELARSAERSLRSAVAQHSSLVGAHWTLSILLYDRGDYLGAQQAAAEARQQDVFLEDWRDILLRLAEASFELGEDSVAVHLCRTGSLRSNQRVFAECELRFVAWSDALPADVDRAWELAAGKRPSTGRSS